MGIIGIVISYLVIISAVFWLNIVGKYRLVAVVFVPFCIWYSAALSFGLNNLLGYPSESVIPDNAIIRGIHINEPSKDYAGIMCFWVIAAEDYGKPDSEPKAHKLPYDRELHKQLMKKSQNKSGVLVWKLSKGRKGSRLRNLMAGRGLPSEEGKFKVLNPETMMKKEETVQLGVEKECEGVCE